MNNIENEPIIRVGILAATSIEFQLKGNFLFNGEIVLPDTYTATISSDTIYCSTNGNDKDKACLVSGLIELIPENSSSTFILKNVTIGIGFHWEKQEDQEFEGGLTLQVEHDNIRAINTVPLESYLVSVISSEMSAMNDINLLNAHAIVSRSWLLAQLQNKGKQKVSSCTQTENEIVKWYDREEHDSFDVCADDHCQRYQGITRIISANAQKAIGNTRGKVLMYKEEICDARFSKCCGGFSEDFNNVWQPVKIPYLVAVRDIQQKMFPQTIKYETESLIAASPEAFCNTTNTEIISQILVDFDRTTTNFYRWTVDYSQEELSKLIARKSGIDFGEIIDLVPLKRGNSGRIIRLGINGTKRDMIVGKELEIRKWLSESHLYSSAFIVKKEIEEGKTIPFKFTLRGAGWGHGVGMCQIGAAVMSNKGYSSVQILEHYYKGATIKNIYE